MPHLQLAGWVVMMLSASVLAVGSVVEAWRWAGRDRNLRRLLAESRAEGHTGPAEVEATHASAPAMARPPFSRRPQAPPAGVGIDDRR